MKSLEGRVSALERAWALILPRVWLTFTDGTQAEMSCTDAILYMAELDARKPGVKPLASAKIDASLPAIGTVWETLRADLDQRAQKGGE